MKLNGPINQELNWYGKTAYFIYNDKTKYWYPEEFTNQDILDDNFKEGIKYLSLLENDIKILAKDDPQISNLINELLNQIIIAKEEIKVIQKDIESFNSFWGGLLGISELMTFFNSQNENTVQKRIELPEKVKHAYDNLERKLFERYRLCTKTINDIENEAFIKFKPSINEKRIIRNNLLSLVKDKINSNNYENISNEYITNLFNYYENEFILTNNQLKSDLKSNVNKNESIKSTLNELVQKWNQSHLLKNSNTFSNLYANSVLFYGLVLSKDKCIQKKINILNKYSDFNQEIFGKIDVVNINKNDFKCYFIKRVTFGQKTKDYPSFLVFSKHNDEWKIIEESDLITEKNLSKKNLHKTSTYNQKKYSFEPLISVISGVLIIECYFGVPGYGENPATDERVYSYILMLEKPVEVISNKENNEEGDYNSTTLGVTEIHLAPDLNVDLSQYINKPIKITGTFFWAYNAHHHTKVLLNVQKVEKL